MFKAIRESISGADGKVSNMRVSTLLIVLVVMGVFIAHNVLAMVRGECGLVPLGWDQISILAAALGLKALQQRGEPAVTKDDSVDAAPDSTITPTTPAVPTDLKE